MPFKGQRKNAHARVVQCIDGQCIKIKGFDMEIFEIRPENALEEEIDDVSTFECETGMHMFEIKTWLTDNAKQFPECRFSTPYLEMNAKAAAAALSRRARRTPST